MARITIEDCNNYVSNRFDLVLIAAQRGKELNHGAKPQIDHVKDKEAIIALREIAAGKLKIENLEKAIVKKTFTEDQEEEKIETHLIDEEINSKVLEEIESLKQHKDTQKNKLFQDEEDIIE